MTKRAELLIMHAKEIQSLISNCEDKSAVGDLPRHTRDQLRYAGTLLSEGIYALTKELGVEVLKP